MMLGPPSSQYQAYVQRAKTYAHLHRAFKFYLVSPAGRGPVHKMAGKKRDTQLSVSTATDATLAVE